MQFGTNYRDNRDSIQLHGVSSSKVMRNYYLLGLTWRYFKEEVLPRKILPCSFKETSLVISRKIQIRTRYDILIGLECRFIVHEKPIVCHEHQL